MNYKSHLYSDEARSYDLILLISITALFVVLLYLKAPFVNGIEDIWVWDWVQNPSIRSYVCLIPHLVIINTCVYIINSRRLKIHDNVILGLLVIAVSGSQILSIYARDPDLSMMADIIVSPIATSFYTDAQLIDNLSVWIRDFHNQNLRLHSLTHPPGPIIYHYLFIQVFGGYAAYASAIGISIVSALGVVAVYVFSSLWSDDSKVRLTASALFTMLPSIVLIFPELDQVYPVLCMLMMYAWVKTVDGDKRYVYLTSACLIVMLLFAYKMLVLGTFFVLYAFRHIHNSRYSRDSIIFVTNRSASVLFHTALFFILLYYAFGYDAISAFFSALENQAVLVELINRPHSIAIIFNLYDFMFGAAILPFILMFFNLFRSVGLHEIPHLRSSSMTIFGIITILVTNFSGLIDYEVARLWAFMLPFIIIPGAIYLANTSKYSQYLVFTSQWVILSTIGYRVVFINI